MKQGTTILALAFTGLSLPLNASEDTEPSLWDSNRIYLGATLGAAHSDISQRRVNSRFADLGYEFDVEIEDRTRLAWGGLIGYQWHRHFATEAGFVDMGSISARISGRPSQIRDYLDSGAEALPQAISGWELAGVGTYPLGEHYYLYGRAGVLFNRSRNRSEQLADQDWNQSSEGPSLGLGVGYHYNTHWRGRLGLSYYQLDHQRTTLAGLTLIYQFGEPAQRSVSRAAPEELTQPTEPAPVAEPTIPTELNLALTFDYNSTAVHDEFVGRLRDVAEQLQQNPELRLSLSGHSDNRGPSEYNQLLSMERAKAVRDFMVEAFGLAPERFELHAYGEDHPFVDNETEEGRSLNRRVIFDWVEQ